MYLDITEEKVKSALIKETKLSSILQRLGKVLVAYSGGVDSTYLLYFAKKTLDTNAQGIFARGAMISETEEQEALNVAKELGLDIKVVDMNIFAVKEFKENPPDRCYYCKKKIFSSFNQVMLNQGCSAIVDGTNFSDSEDFRPGRKALQEIGVISPLRDAEMTKEDIRILSKLNGLPTWDKPSMACLASRIPYGDTITPELLAQVGSAEQILQGKGFIERRVRIHGDVARIEIPVSDFPILLNIHEEIVDEFLKLGFRFITLDLMGIRSGSLNPKEKTHE